MDELSHQPTDPSPFSTRTVVMFSVFILLLFLFPLLNPENSFYRWDTWIYIWPLLLELKTQWLNGQIPFWADGVCAGTPLLANINAAALYPLRIIHYLIPLPFGYNLFVLAHWVLAFSFTYVWICRGLKKSPQAALCAAMIYCFSGYARGMWDSHNFTALPWIPLWFFSLSLFTRHAFSRRTVVIGTAAWTLLILCGDTQQAVLSWLAGCIYVLFSDRKGKSLCFVALITLLGTLLSAPQWLPTWHTMQESYRAIGLSHIDAVERSFHPVRFIEFLIPYFFGTHDVWYGKNLFGDGATRDTPWSASHATGLITWLLVFIALRQNRKRVSLWAGIMFLTAVLLSFGKFLPGFEFWRSLPVIEGFRYPEKYLLWASLAVSVLVARGIDTLIQTQRWNLSRKSWLTIILLLVFGYGCAGVYVLRHDMPMDWVRTQILLSLAYLILCAIPLRSAKPTQTVLWILGIQLLIPWYQEKPLSAAADLNNPPPLASIIRQSDDPDGRFLADPAARVTPLPGYWSDLTRESETFYAYLSSRLQYNSGQLWNIRTADGFSPLEQHRTRNYRLEHGVLTGTNTPPIRSFGTYLIDTGTRWLLTTPDRWMQLQQHGITGNVEQHLNSQDRISLLVHISNTHEVNPPSVTLSRPTSGHIELQISDPIASPLVIAESASGGWRIDPAFPLDVNETGFLTVDVPPDFTGKIHLTYRQLGWETGLALHLIGWIALGLIIFFSRRFQLSG